MEKENINYTPSYFNACRKIAVENTRANAIKTYDESIPQINKLRDVGNRYSIKISENEHRALIRLAKSELGKKLLAATKIEKLLPY